MKGNAPALMKTSIRVSKPELQRNTPSNEIVTAPPSESGAAEARDGAKALGKRRTMFPVSKTRGQKWFLRDGLRDITTLERVRKCGRVPVAKKFIELRYDELNNRAGYGGLQSCGSCACPVCASKIAASRRSDLQHVLAHASANGLFVSMLTLTIRHHSGHRLKTLWSGLSDGWRQVISGRKWQEFRSQLGLIGYVKAVEATHGGNGWHLHQHVILITEKDPNNVLLVFQRKQGRRKNPYPPEYVLPADFVAERWEKGLAKHGLDFLKDSGGLDWRTAKPTDSKTLASYVSKMGATTIEGLSSEATLGQFKKGRKASRTPFQILADIFETGDLDDLELWWEWEKASFGKRFISWSTGLRDWANLGVEETDEEIAAKDFGGETVAQMDYVEWRKVFKAGPLNLLLALESGGVEAAYQWLDSHGVYYVKGSGDPPVNVVDPRDYDYLF
ncbi:MAG: protein rep [Varibaculum cambriense]|nr:protein rep [Varibaculum cambriense]MDU5854132.1 protein rep [Varibaculum cambriense]